MNAVNNPMYSWLNNSIPGSGASAAGIGGTGFSELLAGLGGKGGGSAAGDLMDYLSLRFPNANFSEGSVGETPKDVEEYFGTEEGDNVAVEPGAAEAIAGNPGLSSILENMLAAFEETAGRTQPVDGARVQRNVMITSVTVRFSVSQISGGTGETLGMNELKTAFSEFSGRLAELARKFFGDVETEQGGGSGEDGGIDIVAEEGDGDEVLAEKENPFSGFFAGGMSFSMYFSAGRFSSQGMDGAGTDEAGFSPRDFMDAFRKQGNFQNYMNSTFSYALFGGMAQGGTAGSNPLQSIMSGGMDMFGLSSQGSWRQDGGFMFGFGTARSTLSDLMSLLNSGSSGSVSAPVGTPEPAPVEVPAEAPAEAAAVA